MLGKITIRCGCATPELPVLQELRGALAVLACRGCGAELPVPFGSSPRTTTPVIQQSLCAVETRPRLDQGAPPAAFASVLRAGDTRAHDAFVTGCFEQGRLAWAAACYRPLLGDPEHALVAGRALRQIEALALIPAMTSRAPARSPASSRRRMLGHLVLFLIGITVCLRLQLGYWRDRSEHASGDASEAARRADLRTAILDPAVSSVTIR